LSRSRAVGIGKLANRLLRVYANERIGRILFRIG
jgi:hypothetical protein